MYATVTRRARGSGRIVGPEQRIDVITTLKAMTIWPAYHHFEEKTKGSLAPGKLADFGILSKDPTVVEPTTIADIKVTETVKEGKTIFRLEPGSKAEAPASIMPLLTALAGRGHAEGTHDHGPDDGCPSDAMLRLVATMAAGPAARMTTARSNDMNYGSHRNLPSIEIHVAALRE